MKKRTKKIQGFIAHELLCAYKSDKVTLRLYDILEKVASKYKFTILEMGDKRQGFDVKGRYPDGYWVLLDVLSIMEKMIEAGIIRYFEQGDISAPFPQGGVGNDGAGFDQCGKVTGTFANHIYENLRKSIWISSDIENFVKNGFVPEELSLARQQAKDANCTLRWAVVTCAITVFATIVDIVLVFIEKAFPNGITIHLCQCALILLTIVLCAFFVYTIPARRKVIGNCCRYRK